MKREDLISVREFCAIHQVENTFITSLQQFGLVEVITVEQETYFELAQLPKVEKMANLYSDLGVNIEGLDVIQHLLQKIEGMNEELTILRNKLKEFEG
jgi:hypothetical protein